MVEPGVASVAAALVVALDGDGDGLVALAVAPDRLERLPPGPPPHPGAAPGPHPLVGVAAALAAGALVRAGRAAEVRPLLATLAGRFAPPRRHGVRHVEDLVASFPYLLAHLARAAVALGEHADAVAALLEHDERVFAEPDGGFPDDLDARAALARPGAAALGPFRFDRTWVLALQEEVLARADLDGAREDARAFMALLAENALALGEPERALPVVEPLGESYVRVGSTRHGHLEFHGVCALAALGRHEEAMRRARALVRQGYPTAFRFDLAAAERHPWTQRSRQNEALAGLAATPAYRVFLRDEVAYGPFPVKDPGANTLAAVRDGVLEGRSRRRCWISGALVAPGTPVVRLRPLVGRADDGAFAVADRAAFDASGWARARRDFEADRVPVRALFAPTRSTRRPSRTPAIAAFESDVARDPAAFDPARAFALVAEHAPPPIRHAWITGPESRERAFAPLAGDIGHGDAVNLTWKLLKAGYGPDLFDRAATSPWADKVFAMLATFDRPDCRAAAARHFALPDLGAAVDLAFSERPSLDDHVALAAFGRAHPRWRAGLVAAMRAYALHLYSNARPGADWFREGLERFCRARGCQLLFFLAHHPEDDPVLATMLERRWLPDDVGLGGYDAYANAQPFYHRAAVLHCMLDDPGGLDAWLTTPWIQRLCCGAKDRDTQRLAAAWRKRSRRSRSDDGRKSTPSGTVPHAE